MIPYWKRTFDSLYIASIFFQFGLRLPTIWTFEISLMYFRKNENNKSISLKRLPYDWSKCWKYCQLTSIKYYSLSSNLCRTLCKIFGVTSRHIVTIHSLRSSSVMEDKCFLCVLHKKSRALKTDDRGGNSITSSSHPAVW